MLLEQYKGNKLRLDFAEEEKLKLKKKKSNKNSTLSESQLFHSLPASQGRACKLTSCGRLSLHVHLDQLANWLRLKPVVAFGMTGLRSVFR